MGHSRPTTPFLDSVAEQSIVFRNALASGIPTYYSLPAVMASRHALALGRDVIGIAPGEDTIATELKGHGFDTAAFVAANPYLSKGSGYEQGFDVFEDFLHTADDGNWPQKATSDVSPLHEVNRMLSAACHRVPGLAAAYDELYFRYCQRVSRSDNDSFEELREFPDAHVIVERASCWLRQHSGAPFFLWLHFMDPHAPYYPKQQALCELGSDLGPGEAKYLNSYWGRDDAGVDRLAKKRDGILNLYDAGIRSVDDALRGLANTLNELGIWESCAIAVTADHGEEFLEHGGRFHAPTRLTEELVRVPLLLRVPGAPARVVDEPVGLIDLTPTLLDAIDLPLPAGFKGRSCWPEVRNAKTWTRPVITECAYGCSNPCDRKRRMAPRLLAVRKDRYKLVVNFASGTEALFDLGSDPEELRPLPFCEAKQVRRELLEVAMRHVAQSAKSRAWNLRLAAQIRDLRQQPWAIQTSRPN
jgi:arylsulfatase A-like enzyme